jgi:hypothetical protein
MIPPSIEFLEGLEELRFVLPGERVLHSPAVEILNVQKHWHSIEVFQNICKTFNHQKVVWIDSKARQISVCVLQTKQTWKNDTGGSCVG